MTVGLEALVSVTLMPKGIKKLNEYLRMRLELEARLIAVDGETFHGRISVPGSDNEKLRIRDQFVSLQRKIDLESRT